MFKCWFLVLGVIIADVSARHGSPICQKYYISTHISTTKVGGSLLLMVHFFPFSTTFWMFYIETVFFITGFQRPNFPQVEVSNGGRRVRFRAGCGFEGLEFSDGEADMEMFRKDQENMDVSKNRGTPKMDGL